MRYFLLSTASVLSMLVVPTPDAACGSQNRNKVTKVPAVHYVVAVHPKNKFQGKDAYLRRSIKQFYLKRLTSWPDGSTVRVYGRKAGSAEQSKFQSSVLSMTKAEIARHWLRQKSQHGLTPPKSVSSDRMAVKYVKKHKGAFAIMRADVAKKGGLRVLLTL